MTIPMPEPVAFLVDWPDEPDLGHYFAEEQATIGRSQPLITTTQAEAYADARVREAQQWQPIETAPQDGTPVLLFARLESAETSTRVVGSFILGEWLAQSYVGQNKAVLVPSHWMPLPPFPPLPGPVEP